MEAVRRAFEWHEHVYGDFEVREQNETVCLQLRRSAAKRRLSFCVSAQLDNLWPSACKTKPSRDSSNAAR